MTVSEGEALLVAMDPAHRHTPWTKRPQNWQRMSASDAKTHMSQLTAGIEALVKECEGDKKGCFIKLSCRSAKDVVPSDSVLHSLFLHALTGSDDAKAAAEVKVGPYGPIADPNARICALYEAQIRSMRYVGFLSTVSRSSSCAYGRVLSGAEGLALLMKSKRVSFDIELDLFGLQLVTPPPATAGQAKTAESATANKTVTVPTPEPFQTHVIVRPWVGIPLASEFRAFVSGGKLCAVSQYYTQCFFPSIIKDRELILKRVGFAAVPI